MKKICSKYLILRYFSVLRYYSIIVCSRSMLRYVTIILQPHILIEFIYDIIMFFNKNVTSMHNDRL